MCMNWHYSLSLSEQKFDYHMDLGGLGPARFAIEEFNRRKVGTHNSNFAFIFIFYV